MPAAAKVARKERGQRTVLDQRGSGRRSDTGTAAQTDIAAMIKVAMGGARAAHMAAAEATLSTRSGDTNLRSTVDPATGGLDDPARKGAGGGSSAAPG